MKLLEHQVQGLQETKDQNRVAYYWDMGLGKTFVGSEKMRQLGAHVNLVICQKSKINDWIEHFESYYMDDHDVFNLTNKREFEAFLKVAITGDTDESYKIIGVINYELTFRRPDLRFLEGFTMILDESSMIQNETAKRSKFILRLGDRAANVILLSGTPTGGKYEKLWSQLHLLGWRISKKLYYDQYIITDYLDNIGRIPIPIVVGYKNVDRLKRKLREHGAHFLKTDGIIDLPDQVFNRISIEPTKEYKRFKKHRYAVIDDREFVGDTTLTKMLYERQLCGAYNENKLQAVKDLLQSTEDNFVIFYNFNQELKRLKEICSSCDRQVGIISGSEKTGEKIINYSENHNYRSTLIIQYQAGAMGLNLQNFSNRIIYYSLPLSSELFEQSKKRIHRIGQNKPCFYSILVCRNSVEEKILRALKKRQDYTEKLFESED